ncbi:MAG: FHA domain-containing protein [Deltaproteobacteria bacterium]|nr:FHA domain-containing protein [Deltaproteobacteria bacterium]
MKSIGDYLESAQSLAPEAFANEHGQAFLVHHGSRAGFKDSGALKTIVSDAVTGPETPLNPKRDFVAFGLKFPEGDEPLWLGRSDDNQVAVPDDSVSVVHAFITHRPDGFFIQDTNSRNGTKVNDTHVPPQGEGKPVKLESGCRLRLGDVTLTFLNAGDFQNLVVRLLG